MSCNYQFQTKNLKTCLDSFGATAPRLFGEDYTRVLDTCRKFELTDTDTCQPYFARGSGFGLETPLLGQPYLDVSLAWRYSDFDHACFADNALQGALKRIRRAAKIYRPNDVVFAELDTGSDQSNTLPSLFFQNKSPEDGDTLLTGLWEKDEEPPQWETLRRIWQKISPDWNFFLGLLEGRPHSPLRLLFYDKKLPSGKFFDFKRMEDLCQTLGIPPLGKTAREQISILMKYAITPCPLVLDLMPDGSWGSMVGMEIFQMFPNGKNAPRRHWQELKQELLKMGLADERIHLLDNCEKFIFLPTETAAGKNLITLSQISHIKLRWNDDTPLPAKAYLQIKTF